MLPFEKLSRGKKGNNRWLCVTVIYVYTFVIHRECWNKGKSEDFLQQQDTQQPGFQRANLEGINSCEGGEPWHRMPREVKEIIMGYFCVSNCQVPENHNTDAIQTCYSPTFLQPLIQPIKILILVKKTLKMSLKLWSCHQPSDTCLKLAHDTHKSMIKIAIKGVTHSFDSELHFSDNAGKDIHLKTWSYKRFLYHAHIYILYI